MLDRAVLGLSVYSPKRFSFQTGGNWQAAQFWRYPATDRPRTAVQGALLMNALPPLSIELSTPADAQASGLVTEMASLLAPSYVDCTAVLARELDHCDRLYLARDVQGRLATFFLTAFEDVTVEGTVVPTAYLGLSAARPDLKNSGVVRQLYEAFLIDAGKKEVATCRQLVLWFTTATPSAYKAGQVLFADVEPAVDGSYRTTSVALAAALRYRLHAATGAHPFVLKGIADRTRYSADEVERIRLVNQRHGFHLLADLGVEESQGDRLLVIAKVPACYRQ